MTECVFQLPFGALFAIFVPGQFINAMRSVTLGGKGEVKGKHPITVQVLRKSIGVAWFGAILVYVLKPGRIDGASFP